MIKFFLNILNKINNDVREQLVKTAIALSILATVYLLSDNIFLSFIIGTAIAILLLGWDSRVFIGIGLIFLIACPFLLAVGKKALAEEMAVYAYYMLALGVILQIFQYAQNSFFAKKKNNKRKKSAALEFAGKKKTLIFAIVIGLVFLLAFGGYFYYLYAQIKKEALENKKLLNSLIQTNAINEKQATSLSAPAATVSNGANITKNNVKIIIETNADLEAIGTAVAGGFNQLGYLNITFVKTTMAAEQSTLIEYCSDCYEMANELLSSLQKSNKILFIEKTELAEKIIIKVGKDQKSISRDEINISLLNGTATASAVLKLKAAMVNDGFKINNVATADKNDYQTTIIKYHPAAKDKADIVKEYLLPHYTNLELFEDNMITTDIEVIIGEK